MKPGVLHIITDTTLQRTWSHADLARAAAAGGADVVQFREKRPWTTADLLGTVASMARALQGSTTRLLINDRVDVAAAAGINNVHLGRHDLPPLLARSMLGPHALIGGTANTLSEALEVAAMPVDYVSVGPVFGTRSKARAAPALGLEGLRDIVDAVEKPVIAVGNMTVERVADVLSTGAVGIAVLGAVVLDKNPEAATRRLRTAIDSWLQ